MGLVRTARKGKSEGEGQLRVWKRYTQIESSTCAYILIPQVQREGSLQGEGGTQREFHIRCGGAWEASIMEEGYLLSLVRRKEKGMRKSAEIIRCSRVLAGGKGWRDEGVLTG